MNRIRSHVHLPVALLAVLTGLAVAPAAHAQDGMGRLFFSPAQRAQLDIARQRNVRAPIQGEQPTEEAQPLPQEVRLNGVIRRNDGRTPFWLNNKMVAPDAAILPGTVETRARGDGSVTLSLPQTGRSVDLKVGQTVEALSGQIAEVYQPRAPLAPGPEVRPAPGSTPAPQTVEKVTPAPPGSPQTATKVPEPVEPKRKRDDGPPWDMLQYSTK